MMLSEKKHKGEGWARKSKPPKDDQEKYIPFKYPNLCVLPISHPVSNLGVSDAAQYPSPLGDSDRRRATALVSLGGHDLVVVRAEAHAERGPGIEVVLSGDGSAGALGATNRPVLGEGGSAGDGRLVHLLVGVDIINGSITGDGSLLGHAAAGVVLAVAFHDVVLDERALGPAVHSKVGVTRGLEGSGEVDVPLHVLVVERRSGYDALTGQNQSPSPCRR